MTDIRFDVTYSHATLNPDWACKIVGESDYSPLYEKTIESLDFFIENGMDIMDCFEFLYDIVEGCL